MPTLHCSRWLAPMALTLSMMACLGEMTVEGVDGGGSSATVGGGSAGGELAAGGTAGGTAGGRAGGTAAGGVASSTGGGSVMAGSAAGRGLAAAYPSDVGIEQDPDVLWAESFEEPSVAALTARYTSAQNPANLQLIRDAPSGAGQSLEVTATPSSTGGGLYRSLGAGHDEVYLRYYIRYSNAAYHHTTVNVGGVNPSVQPWVTQGPVGLCCTAPDGDKALSVSAEVFSRSGGTFAFDFYNYWWEMRSWGNVVTPPTGSTERDPLTGQNKVPAAGNTFLSGVEPRLAFDRWYAIEVHVKLNTPPARDGVLALWIDGRLVHEFRAGSPMGQYVGTNFSPSPGGAPFPGLSYRSSTALTLNYLWITHYATQVPPGTTTSVHYDQLVLAKRYIGPMAP